MGVRYGSWRSAVGLGLLVPALAFSTSFTFSDEPQDPTSPLASALPSPPLSIGPELAPPTVTELEAPRFDRGSSRSVALPIEPIPPMPRREGAPLIALQAGHWRSSEVPRELNDLQYNGTVGGGKAEWEVTLEIATRTKALLEARGYAVEILPTTVPPAYTADLFISIHADGYNDPAVSGFTVGAPRRDATRRAAEFVEVLGDEYAKATSLRRRMNVTRRMQNYYAFNSRRYDHALHPMTVGVILETGFLTSPADRRVIVDNQELSAQGIAEAVFRFVPLPETPPETLATAAATQQQ